MKTIYEAFDGKRFKTKDECTNYEKKHCLQQHQKELVEYENRYRYHKTRCNVPFKDREMLRTCIEGRKLWDAWRRFHKLLKERPKKFKTREDWLSYLYTLGCTAREIKDGTLAVELAQADLLQVRIRRKQLISEIAEIKARMAYEQV